MAQAQSEEKPQEQQPEIEIKDKTPTPVLTAIATATATANASASPTAPASPSSTPTSSSSSSGSPFKFNAHAPEFVPRTQNPVPVSGYYYPYYHYLGGSSGSEWLYVGGDQDQTQQLYPDSSYSTPTTYSKHVLTSEMQQRIIKQVEYQLSDMSLLANENLTKHINKDPEGYVPIPVIASAKKIKSITSNHHWITQALRSAPSFIVSSDGKKVKRKHPFTEKDREDLQSRTVVAENLPEDHSHPNLQKIFGVVGRVKNIRICHPQEPNSSRPKGDFVISNKLHALVEFESTEMAEKAVEKLNDERNWRKGLRVRLLLRCSPKSVLKSRKSEFEGIFDDDDTVFDSVEESTHSHSSEVGDNAEETSSGIKKFSRPRGRPRPRPTCLSHIGRGLLASPTQSSGGSMQCDSPSKLTVKGPRMPDGTRGFTMGRGKPLVAAPVLATAASLD